MKLVTCRGLLERLLGTGAVITFSFFSCRRLRLDPDLDLGLEVAALLDNSAALHKLAVRPRRRHVDARQLQQETR